MHLTIRRRLALAWVALVFSAAAVWTPVGPTAADPPFPVGTDLVAAGGGTAGVYENAVSAAVGVIPGTSSHFYSWDEVGFSPIAAKTTCNPPAGVPRPSSLLSGVFALESPYNGRNAGGFRDCFDFVRSDAGPTSTDPNGSTDYLPFAKDAVGWAAFTGGNAPSNLNSQQLINIFSCNPSGNNPNGIQTDSFNWTDVVPAIPGASATPVHVYVPQLGSGVMDSWIQVLGLPADFFGQCWQGTRPEENEGTDPAFAGDVNAIVPYSLGHYVGQKYLGQGAATDNVGVLDANRQIDGVNQLTISGTTGAINTTTPGAGGIFAHKNFVTNVVYGHMLGHDVLAQDWIADSGAQWAALQALLGSRTGWICSHPSYVAAAGFLPITSLQCGTAIPGAY